MGFEARLLDQLSDQQPEYHPQCGPRTIDPRKFIAPIILGKISTLDSYLRHQFSLMRVHST